MMRKRLPTEIGVLFLGLFACLWFAAAALAQKPTVKPVGQVALVDSTGKIVGHVLGGLGWGTTVLLKIDERLVAVNVRKDGYQQGTLYFDLPNCLGIPWLPFVSPLSSFLTVASIGPPGNTVYVPQQGVPSAHVRIQSWLRSDGCSPFFNETIHVTPTESLINLDTVFTPPFSVRTAP